MSGSAYCMSPVASSRMTVSEMVMRAMPPSTAAAPTSAYVPASAKVPRLASK